MLEWQLNSPDTNPIENVGNIMKKEVGNKMPCLFSYFVKMKRCGSEYMKRCIVKHGTSWENFTIQCQGEMQILFKRRGCNKILTLGCRHIRILLFFNWNVFKVECVFIGIYLILINKCCLKICRNRMA